MQIRVLFFGTLKDMTGQANDALTLQPGATVSDVLAHYRAKYPRLEQYANALAVSVNQEYAARDAALHEGDEVGLLPPVSGGKGSEPPRMAPEPLVRIVHERIRPHDMVPPLERPEDGAIVIFDGVVRNHSRGRRTLHLEYEAYEEMALRKLRELAAEAMARFAIRNVALVHRLGRVEIGESSVLIAVFSAHRAAAFEACRWIIDTLKRTVPIWKKEFFEDGAVWADGEPFPPEVIRNLAAEPESK
jgi:molybdopterin converting factor subunit 1